MNRRRNLLTIFYVVVVLIALAGQALGAVNWLHAPLLAAICAVGALEFGGVVLAQHADHRLQLGERAIAARLGSALVAGFAVTFNWLGHQDHMLGGFFAGMSALGYAVWLLDSGARRRDRLRERGMLAEVPPAYGAMRWLRHPILVREARALAVERPSLGLHGSIAAAVAARRQAGRTAAIAKVLHRKIRAAVDPTTADIAVNVYDLDEIARRLADDADYAGLTALIGADLAAVRIAGAEVPVEVPPALPAAEGPSSDRDPIEKPFMEATPDTVPASAPTSGAPATRKRTVEETYRLAEALIKGDPELRQSDVADVLAITPRRLRDILRKGREASTGPAETGPESDAPWPAGPRAPESTAALVAA